MTIGFPARTIEEKGYAFMANRVFQSVIYQMKDAIDRVIGVIDENGVIIACSELVRIGEIRQGVRDELNYTSDVVTSAIARLCFAGATSRRRKKRVERNSPARRTGLFAA